MTAHAPSLHIVGIGTSAGGLGALRTLFSTMPPSPGAAFVVITHLSPHHESQLAPLLQPYTAMRVEQVTDTVAIEPNRVYVIPPNANLDTIDSHLRLSRLEARRNDRAPIDHFLRTLASTHDGQAIGVILTGTGSDGALGLRHIKERGGLTVAQDPLEAEYDGMPRSAIETGLVDAVLPLREIGAEILRFCSAQPVLPTLSQDDTLDGTDAAVLAEIVAALRTHTNQEFGVYTRSMLLKRIGKRMQLRNVRTLAEYAGLLDAAEAHALAGDLLLSVTDFFRDAPLYQRLEEDVLPPLFDLKSAAGQRVRAWTIGCSTGEEAYSLAMLMLEARARRSDVNLKLQVFASDMSDDMLALAREGLYPREVAALVSSERLERFFVREGTNHYRVGREVRDSVVFTSHNLFRDPPLSSMDLVVCRHSLKDLQPDLKLDVQRLLHFALAPHGILVVDPDEPIDGGLFAVEDFEHGIYRRGNEGGRAPTSIPLLPKAARAVQPASPSRLDPGGSAEFASIHAQLIEHYAPPSVLVNARNEVVHYSAFANRYLRIPGGEITHDVVRLVQEPIASMLSDALIETRFYDAPWHSQPVSIDTDEGVRRLVLRIEPVHLPAAASLRLVVFDEVRVDRLTNGVRRPPAVGVAQLEAELAHVQQRLATLMYGLDDAIAAPMEGTVAEAELRRMLDVVQASKEELQVLNEEMTTLDVENQRRVAELAKLSDDLENFLESTGLPTLFLDRELKIVRFTAQMGEHFHVRLHDRGRPLSDIQLGLHYDEIADDARRVLQHKVVVEREVADATDRWYLVRMLPYRSTQSVRGVVITLIDITGRKRAEEELRELARRKDEFLAMLAHELRNPLAPISSGIDVLRLAGEDPRIRDEITTMMSRQTKQLVRLVDDLVEVSRISGGRMRLRKANVRLVDVVNDAVATVRPMIDRAGQTLTTTLPDAPIVLEADAARLTQVLANILVNATRYSPSGGRIELAVRQDGGNALISVKDDGYGISADVIGHIFEMFYQGDNTRSPRPGSLGIGLTLARTLVEMHGGTLSAHSPGPDQGSEFVVSIPVSTTQSTSAAPLPERAPAKVVRHRVLIVDDNKDAAHMLGVLVGTIGVNDIRVAFSGKEAMRLGPQLLPDTVFLDLKMPDMDGYEVARRIRGEAWGRHVNLIALTGWGLDEHRQRAKEAGFDNHLTKPVDRVALEAILQRTQAAPEPARQLEKAAHRHE